ncbi:MAG: 6-hydroxymethylpterin diphosphokinase MptE-like protein [Chlamydiota bacterium]
MEEALSYDVICLWGFSEEQVQFLEGKTLIFFTSELKYDLLNRVYYDGEVCDLEQFQSICEKEVFRSFFYLIHPDLLEKEIATMWLGRCRVVEWQVQLAASDYQDFGVKVFKNLCQLRNASFDESSFSLMKDLFQDVPAFICGAGPSLGKEIAHLKEVQNQGLIFAGGAALGSLGHLGVPIHIAAGIDPDPHYDKVLMRNSFEAPFFYQSRFSASLRETVQGPLFQVANNPGYALESWLQEDECFDGGWTVSTFCAAIALHLGCNPIVFVGMDLSYSSKGEEGRDIAWEDPIQGDVRTQKDWILAAKWLEEMTSLHKDHTFYTVSDSGLFIKGVKRSSFKELELCNPVDSEGLVHLLRSFWTPSREYGEKMEVVKKSLDRSLEYVEALLNLFEKHYPLDPTGKGGFVLNLLDLQEEIVYQKILMPVWNVWQFPLYRQFEEPYARDVNQMVFFKKVLQEYRMCICN